MSRRTPRWRILLSLLFCLSLIAAPSLAEARAGMHFGGGGSSFGSRGVRSYESNGASPLSRSATPYSSYRNSYGGSFISRHPFLTGLFGGFLFAHLFGGGFFGHAFGGLFTLLIIGFLIYLLYRGLGGGFSSAGGGMMMRSVGAAAAPSAAPAYRGHDIGVADADLSAFQAIHAQIQEGWGRGDLGHLRPLMTPEMLSYFSEELTRNASQGVQNLVSDVRLTKGEITEAWEEGDLQYATAFMQWSAVDYTVRLGQSANSPDLVVSGNPRTPVEQEEVWTFVRSRGGHWLLSAIQQV